MSDGVNSPASMSSIPVVMCTWARLHRLAETLEMLANQRSVRAELHIWNNNALIVDEVERIVADGPQGVVAELHHSGRNVGGFGRFFKARQLARGGKDRVVFIDDDVTFDDDMLLRFDHEFRDDQIRSFWAFQCADRTDYWQRRQLSVGTTERADYCGTGGMIAPTSVFLDSRLFRCPPTFWFIEDLWLSYFATHVLGLELRRSDNEVVIHKDMYDQALDILPQKTLMLNALCEQYGWRLESEGRGIEPGVAPSFPEMTRETAALLRAADQSDHNSDVFAAPAL